MSAKTKWVIDPSHSEIAFKVKHLMISNVKGLFSEFTAEVLTDGDDFSTAEISFSMSAASINTGNADRDGHLKSADFFDAETYSTINFANGTLVAGDSSDEFTLNGELTIKGISKPASFSVEFGGAQADPWGNEKAGFTIEGKINRKDWGLNWNAALETGGVLVGEEVKINCEIELAKVKG